MNKHVKVYKHKRRFVVTAERESPNGFLVTVQPAAMFGDMIHPSVIGAYVWNVLCLSDAYIGSIPAGLGKWNVNDGGIGSLIGGKSWDAFEKEAQMCMLKYDGKNIQVRGFEQTCDGFEEGAFERILDCSNERLHELIGVALIECFTDK